MALGQVIVIVHLGLKKVPGDRQNRRSAAATEAYNDTVYRQPRSSGGLSRAESNATQLYPAHGKHGEVTYRAMALSDVHARAGDVKRID